MGTTKIEESSSFFVSSNEDGESPYEFSIMYMADSPLKDRGIKPISRYLYAPVNTFGNNSGPLTLRLDAKDTKTKMTLHSRRVRHFNPVDTADWVSSSDIFYLNCKQRTVKKNGYIGVKRTPHGVAGITAEYITYCVPSIKSHSETKDQYMLFRLLRANKREPKTKHEEKGEEEDEPLGVRKWTKKASKSFSVDEEFCGDDQLATGEDTVDCTSKKKSQGDGEGGTGKGRSERNEGKGGKGKKGAEGRREKGEKKRNKMAKESGLGGITEGEEGGKEDAEEEGVES